MKNRSKQDLSQLCSRQQGFMTLTLVCSILMLVALFSFSVMRVARDEIKKTQNLVIGAKQKANAKASLDCAIAHFIEYQFSPEDFELQNLDACKTAANVEFSFTAFASYWQLSAKQNQAIANVLLGFAQPSLASFITSSDVKITRGNTWQPAAGKSVLVDGVEYVQCSTILARGELDIDLENASPDFTSHTASNNKSCLPTFASHFTSNQLITSSLFSKDIQTQLIDLDPFSQLFGVAKSGWLSVRDNFDLQIITGNAVTDRVAVSACGENIKAAIEAGNQLIWVEGDCLLNGLSDVESATQSPLVVIKNGIVGASQAITNLNASFYQFSVDHSSQQIASSWGANATNQCAHGAMQHICLHFASRYNPSAIIWQQLPFYFTESFKINGSYFVDIAQSKALIDGVFELNFDENLKDNPFIHGKLSVLKGSLHEF